MLACPDDCKVRKRSQSLTSFNIWTTKEWKMEKKQRTETHASECLTTTQSPAHAFSWVGAMNCKRNGGEVS